MPRTNTPKKAGKIPISEQRPVLHQKQPDNGQQGIYQLEERRKLVAEMYLRNWSQWEIANHFGLSQNTIQDDLKVIQSVWQQKMVESFDEHKRRELAKIDNLERVANEAYIRSMGIRKTVTKTSGSNGEYTKDEMKIVREKLLGDPRWMDQIKWCIEMRCKILGITKESKDVQVNNLMTLNWEQIVQARTDGADINKEIRELELLSGIKTEDVEDDKK